MKRYFPCAVIGLASEVNSQQLTVSTGQPDQLKSRRNLFLAIALLAIIAMASVTVFELSNQAYQNTQTSPRNLPSQSWMIEGAYATYQGQIIALFIPVEITGKIQVNGLNATHVQVQTDMNLSTPFAPPIADRTVVWINKTSIDFAPKGEILTRTYDSQIVVENLGSRSCIVYEYANQAINATYYVDKTLQWPLKIVYTTAFENQTYAIEVSLKETNINGL